MGKRVFLPVLDRRMVLRGLAATLAASLTGCRITLDDPEHRTFDTSDDDDPRPDAGTSGGVVVVGSDAGVPDGGTPVNAIALDLADPDNAPLLQVDGARIITAAGKRLLVIRLDASTFIALSALCTHAGCTVNYAPARSDIVCPCHGSTFALDGAVTHGPAVKPLAAFETTFDSAANRVTIVLG